MYFSQHSSSLNDFMDDFIARMSLTASKYAAFSALLPQLFSALAILRFISSRTSLAASPIDLLNILNRGILTLIRMAAICFGASSFSFSLLKNVGESCERIVFIEILVTIHDIIIQLFQHNSRSEVVRQIFHHFWLGLFDPHPIVEAISRSVLVLAARLGGNHVILRISKLIFESLCSKSSATTCTSPTISRDKKSLVFLLVALLSEKIDKVLISDLSTELCNLLYPSTKLLPANQILPLCVQLAIFRNLPQAFFENCPKSDLSALALHIFGFV